jgi:hypothetical protein
MVRVKVNSVLLKRMQTGLNYASNWCEEANLRIKSYSLKNLVMRTVSIEFSRETKYLGVVSDDKHF